MSGSKLSSGGKSKRLLRVAFLHPDLGIGGAERLVVDAAVAVQSKGHTVTLFTSHHDPKHCFDETRNGQLAVQVFGDFFPTRSCGKLAILWAIVRNLYCALRLALQCLGGDAVKGFDVIVVDQLSISVPLLRCLTGSKILFYCHFPDLLLSQRSSLLRRLYRLPFDWLEEATTGQAHKILVNSNFTKQTFANTFSRIRTEHSPEVLYPCINLPQYDTDAHDARAAEQELASWQQHGYNSDCILFVSINRFERKKNVALALRAFARMLSALDAATAARCRLVVAGGYDARVAENVENCGELQALASSLALASTWYPTMQPRAVCFLRSFSNTQRSLLLARARAVLYTPHNEHFGIVPVEAMYCRAPVIATASGGPLESVLHGETGFLCAVEGGEGEGGGGKEEGGVGAFAEAMALLARDRRRGAAMGKAGRQHVVERFSLASFATRLDSILAVLANEPQKLSSSCWGWWGACILATLVLAIFVAFVSS